MVRATQSSRFSRQVLNLMIGMCRGVPGIPRGLADLGYEDRWIDHKFRNQDGDIAHPDLLVSSRRMANTLLIELKSGANVEVDQLKRDSRVRSDDLVRGAFIDREASQTSDLLVVGQSVNVDRLQLGIDEASVATALVCTTDEGLELRSGRFTRPELETMLRPRLDIMWDRVPTYFVPIDAECEDWEIAEQLGPALLVRMQRREPSFGIDDLCRDVFELTWSILGRPAKDALRARFRIILRLAVDGPFGPFVRLNRDLIRVIDNPLPWGTAKATRAYRHLTDAQTALVASLQPGGALQLRLPGLN
jgi:hypothetical protein